MTTPQRLNNGGSILPPVQQKFLSSGLDDSNHLDSDLAVVFAGVQQGLYMSEGLLWDRLRAYLLRVRNDDKGDSGRAGHSSSNPHQDEASEDVNDDKGADQNEHEALEGELLDSRPAPSFTAPLPAISITPQTTGILEFLKTVTDQNEETQLAQVHMQRNWALHALTSDIHAAFIFLLEAYTTAIAPSHLSAAQRHQLPPQPHHNVVSLRRLKQLLRLSGLIDDKHITMSQVEKICVEALQADQQQAPSVPSTVSAASTAVRKKKTSTQPLGKSLNTSTIGLFGVAWVVTQVACRRFAASSAQTIAASTKDLTVSDMMQTMLLQLRIAEIAQKRLHNYVEQAWQEVDTLYDAARKQPSKGSRALGSTNAAAVGAGIEALGPEMPLTEKEFDACVQVFVRDRKVLKSLYEVYVTKIVTPPVALNSGVPKSQMNREEPGYEGPDVLSGSNGNGETNEPCLGDGDPFPLADSRAYRRLSSLFPADNEQSDGQETLRGSSLPLSVGNSGSSVTSRSIFTSSNGILQRGMDFTGLSRFARDFDLVPHLVTRQQLMEIVHTALFQGPFSTPGRDRILSSDGAGDTNYATKVLSVSLSLAQVQYGRPSCCVFSPHLQVSYIVIWFLFLLVSGCSLRPCPSLSSTTTTTGAFDPDRRACIAHCTEQYWEGNLSSFGHQRTRHRSWQQSRRSSP